MKELKFIFETNVKKLVEEKVVEIRKENGKDVEISRPVKKVKPVKIAILKPNRKLYELAEIYYAKNMSSFIKAGLLPYSLVAKRYANDGGPLTDSEIKRLEILKQDALKLETTYFAT